MATINSTNSTINSTTSGMVSSSNVGLLTSTATTNHAVQLGNASGTITSLGVGATNTVLLGNTGADPSFGTVPNAALSNSSITVSGGAGISISGSPVSLGGTVTITATGGGVTWSVITASQTAAVSNGYFCNKAGVLALLLPATSVVGDIVYAVNINTAADTQITQASGQQIFIGNTSTTLGATGSLTSTAIGDCLTLVCRAANTTWQAIDVVGNWTVA
jgi:hypothetical protein